MRLTGRLKRQERGDARSKGVRDILMLEQAGKGDSARTVTADWQGMSITEMGVVVAVVATGVLLSGCSTAPPESCATLAPQIVRLSEEQNNPLQPTILKVSDAVEIERSDVKLACQGAARLSSNESAQIEFFWEIDSDGDAFIGYNDAASPLAGGIYRAGASESVVTRSEYGQIQNGMTYQQVVEIIGVPGEEVSSNEMLGVPGVMDPIETVMYMWSNPDGSNMNAMFQNDALMQKAQFGLP